MDVGVWLRSLGLGQYEAAFRVAPAAIRRLSRCRRGLTRLVLGFMGFEARHVGNPEALLRA